MDIINFFKGKKNRETNLIRNNQTSPQINNSNRKKIKHISDFIENALTENGGNYNDIYSKLIAIAKFTKEAKSYGVLCDFEKINEALNDFFNSDANIKFSTIKDMPHSAWYYKNDKYNRYNYRGVSV